MYYKARNEYARISEAVQSESEYPGVFVSVQRRGGVTGRRQRSLKYVRKDVYRPHARYDQRAMKTIIVQSGQVMYTCQSGTHQMMTSGSAAAMAGPRELLPRRSSTLAKDLSRPL